MFERPERHGRRQAPAAARRRDGRVTLVAEAAQGFEGDLTLARLLVRAAAEAGADLVKFQLVFADELTTPRHHHHQLFADLEMPDAAWHAIADEARREGIGLACDVFGPRSLRLAVACGALAVKIHASDVLHRSLVADALDHAPHVYLSLGGVLPDEVTAELAALGPARTTPERLTLLVGFQAEPTLTVDTRLSRLAAWRERCPAQAFGYMDHTDGAADEAGWLAALALPYGVVAIEKHLTLDRPLEIEDFVSALPPSAFAQWVQRVRLSEDALGDAALALSPAELVYRRKALKVVVATRDLPAGATLTAADVTLLRTAMPSEGVPALRIADVVGRQLRAAVAQYAPVMEGTYA